MAQERSKSGGGSKEKEHSTEEKKAQFDVNALFEDLEARARKFISNAEEWIEQGDDVIGKAKTWVEQHPVALAMATKYGRKVSIMPHSSEELKEAAHAARKRARKSTRHAMEVVRDNPMEIAVVGLALGTIVWAGMRAARGATA